MQAEGERAGATSIVGVGITEQAHAVAHAQRMSHDFVQAQRSAAQVLAAAGINPD
jgi:hypothetical protein